MIRDGPGGSVAVHRPFGACGHRRRLGERIRAVVRSRHDRDRLAGERQAGAAHQEPVHSHRTGRTPHLHGWRAATWSGAAPAPRAVAVPCRPRDEHWPTEMGQRS